ncbi:MAG TPA: tetratricopeptide repeat protein [Actinocrinis sp.]|nr:tetratricopeptide repeat protein [Actinocrinis sp.]
MRFGLLGPLTLAVEAREPVPVDGARLRVLCAALLLRANTAVSAEDLAEAVWDRMPPSGAARTLRSHIGRLRRLLGAEGGRVVARAPGYLIRVEPPELDVLEFDRLCQAAGAALREGAWRAAEDAADAALRLWRGEPLADVNSQMLRDSVVPWLERLRVQVIEDRAEAGLRLGRDEQLVADLRETVAAYPLRERLRGQLMLALYRSGRQAEALAAYQDARKLLVAELGAEPGPYLRGLHESILADEVDPAVPAASFGSPAKGAPVAAAPRQLPAAAGCFTGRRGELDRIIGLLGAPRSPDVPGGTVVISAIDGMAGVGKTALAVHAAYRLAESFPDGHLFVDLHGYTKGFPPRQPAAALGSLLQGLGVPAPQIPRDLEECAALYRHRLAGTRTLIVLDNALNEAQVRPLVPGAPGCLVLITSRRRLKGLHDAHVVALDVLPETDALALLRTLISPLDSAADEPALAEIVELCGRLPLALRIVGALLRHRPAWSARYLADLLRDEHRRLATLADGDHDLRAVLDLSYLGLGERHRLLLRRLALLPGPDLDAFAVAALLGSDPVAAAGQLEDLVDHSLLIAHAPGRYRLHDLIRAYARALSDGDARAEREAAVDRLLHYYAHTAQSASVPLACYPRPAPAGPAPAHSPALADPDTARAWLRAERENLEAAHARAGSLELDRHAVALAAGLAEILRTDGPLTRALDLHQAAADTAERHGWTTAHANALGDLGGVLRLTGNLSGAARAETRALEIWQALGDRGGEATALAELGHVWCLTGDFPGAADAHAHALDIFRETGHRLGEAAALTELGRVRLLTGDYIEAADAATRGLELSRAIGHRLGEADCLIGLGRVRLVMGDLPGAGDALSQALEIYRAIGHRHGQANALLGLGNVRRLNGDLPGAADAAQGALEIFRTIGHRHGEANALADLGRVRLATGDPGRAEEADAQALEIFRAIGHRHGQAEVLIELGSVRRLNKDLSGADDAAMLALDIYREIGHRHGEASAMVELGQVRLAAGDASGAEDAVAGALEIFRKAGNRNAEAWALNSFAAAVAASGDLTGALALYRQAVEMNRELEKPDDEAIALEGVGECRLSLGETDPALDHLRHALAIYDRLGMAADADRVRERLAAGPEFARPGDLRR